MTKGVGDVWQCDATPAQGEMWEKTSTTEWVDMLHESADPSQQSRWKLDYLMQELCVQRQMETRWQNLVETMAPRCFGEFSAIENQILRLLTKAAGELNFKGLDQECQLSVRVPPSRDFSQDVVADILRRQERKQMTIFAERVNVAADSPPGDSATRTVSAKVPPKKD